MTDEITISSAMPTRMPPKKLRANDAPAPRSENDPVVSAAMANWNDTTPDASLMSDSPESRTSCLGVRDARLESDETATASVGPSAAPRAKAATSGMDGSIACAKKPTMSATATTSPMARDATGRRFDQSATLSTPRAS